jgi:glycosyltransferase involved in cell wall biosynthesis
MWFRVEKMKVLYFTYPTAFNFFGGGEIQLLRTKESIEKIRDDCHVKLFDIFHDRLEDFDMLHNFAMSPDCLSLCRMAKKKSLKVVVSPIFWPDSEFKIFTKPSLHIGNAIRGKADSFFVHLKRFYENLGQYKIASFKPLYPYKEFLDLSDVILPNSEIEASIMSSMFRIEKKKFRVIPNGVDKRYLDAKPDLFVKKFGLQDFVLFVGRLERRKNVMALLTACEGLKVPIVIIGHSSVWEQDYYDLIKNTVASHSNIHYLGYFPPDSEELLSAYAAAKVFVLPSWYETPGLAALEAGLAGCNVVITNRGSTTEYFKNSAIYVDPRSAEDIRRKIQLALARPKSSDLRKLILSDYTWETVAKKTLEAYNSVMD